MEQPNLPHKLQTISISVNESSRSAVVNLKKDSLNKLDTIKASISAEMHEIFLALQGHTNAALKDLSILRKTLSLY